MPTVVMTCHHEAGTWWAESADLTGFSAAAGTLQELFEVAVAGVHFELDDAPVDVRFLDESGAALDANSAFVPARKAWWTLSEASGSPVPSEPAQRRPALRMNLVPA